MATPIWLKQTTYNTSSMLSMGRMIISFQRNDNASNETLPVLSYQPSACQFPSPLTGEGESLF